jgi:hypothetical protein
MFGPIEKNLKCRETKLPSLIKTHSSVMSRELTQRGTGLDLFKHFQMLNEHAIEARHSDYSEDMSAKSKELMVQNKEQKLEEICTPELH